MGRHRADAVHDSLVADPKGSAGFYDFDEYERLVAAAHATERHAYLIVLLGGEAGLRCGEMMALEWSDVDLGKRQLCVQRSDWKGHVTATKGGRLRYVPLTLALAAALREHRHLRGARVLCQRDGSPLTQKIVQDHVRRAVAACAAREERRASAAAHVLFASRDARGAGAGDSGARRAHGSRARRSGTCTSVPRRSMTRSGCWMSRNRQGFGDILETGEK